MVRDGEVDVCEGRKQRERVGGCREHAGVRQRQNARHGRWWVGARLFERFKTAEPAGGQSNVHELLGAQTQQCRSQCHCQRVIPQPLVDVELQRAEVTEWVEQCVERL